MLVRIKETGELKELVIVDDNGIAWEKDLIGNANSSIEYNSETEEYEAEQEEFDWWVQYIKDYQADEAQQTELEEELGINIEQRIIDALRHENDMNDHHRIKQQVFAEVREGRKNED